ncbi:hypothetical protein [Nocardiopsis sp. NPDC057823]|uniref:hypothetical protein n=1 Tax=Nocardiopsis sp. NPDC057823 TaxID=3346256 RepID=UPI00366C9535
MDWVQRNGDLVFLLCLVTLVIALSYSTLVGFILPYAVGGSALYAHGLAAAIDAVWVYALLYLTRGRATNPTSKRVARILLYGALSVSIISAGFFGFTSFGVVAAVLYVLPALGVLGVESLMTSTFIGAPAVTVTRPFITGTETGKATEVPTDLVGIANEIVSEVRTGEKRPGWNRVANRYSLSQSDARKVVGMVKEATGV